MKKVSQWIEEFPEPFRSQAFKNSTPINIGKKVENAPSALYLAFPWNKSPEGFGYWNDFKQTLTKR